MPVADTCICTVVAAQALTSLLEAARELGRPGSSGQGIYRDSHPWLVARELLDLATSRGERMAVMFAVEPSAGEREGPAPRMKEPSAGEREGLAPAGTAPLRFSHWAHVRSIEVHELHKGAWETRCAFGPIEPVNAIWEPLDSVVLAPSAEQRHRERMEPIKKHRQLLDANLIRPYAVCETPAFIAQDVRVPSGTPP